MPRFDRTGPGGQGSQTGRGLGNCNPKKQITTKERAIEEQPNNSGRKRGGGLGSWFRFGRRNNQGQGLGRNNP